MIAPVTTPDRVTASESSAVSGRAKAEAAAGEFEQILIQQMITGLRKTTSIDGEDGGLFGKGAGTDTYNDWFDAHLSKHLMNSGGVGVRETMLRDWERLGHIAPRATDGDAVEDGESGESTPTTLWERKLQDAQRPLPPRQLPIQLPPSLGQSTPSGGLHAFA